MREVWAAASIQCEYADGRWDTKGVYCLWEGKAKEAKYLYSIAQSVGELHFACDHHHQPTRLALHMTTARS